MDTRAETVRVFWDIENMAIPSSIEPLKFCKLLAEIARSFGKRVDRITVFCSPTTLSEKVQKAFLMTCITVEIIRNDKLVARREIADRALEHDVLFWLLDQERSRIDPWNSCAIIITSDNDFAVMTAKLANRGFNVVNIMRRIVANDALGQMSIRTVFWEDILQSQGVPSDMAVAAPAPVNGSASFLFAVPAPTASVVTSQPVVAKSLNAKEEEDEEPWVEAHEQDTTGEGEDDEDDARTIVSSVQSIAVIEREVPDGEAAYVDAVAHVLRAADAKVSVAKLRKEVNDYLGSSSKYLNNAATSVMELLWLRSLPFVEFVNGSNVKYRSEPIIIDAPAPPSREHLASRAVLLQPPVSEIDCNIAALVELYFDRIRKREPTGKFVDVRELVFKAKKVAADLHTSSGSIFKPVRKQLVAHEFIEIVDGVFRWTGPLDG